MVDNKRKSRALKIVKTYFPNVTKVKDGEKDIRIEVTAQDNANSRVRDHNACAMAVACKRELELRGVIVAVKVVYLIKGNEATRYFLAESASREVVSFDREAGFAPGTYQLKAPSEAKLLGTHYGGGKNGAKGTGKGAKRQFRHRTTGIRTALGSKHAPDGITVGD